MKLPRRVYISIEKDTHDGEDYLLLNENLKGAANFDRPTIVGVYELKGSGTVIGTPVFTAKKGKP